MFIIDYYKEKYEIETNDINEIYVTEVMQTTKGTKVVLKSASAGQIFSKFYPKDTPQILEKAAQDIKTEILKHLQKQAQETENAYNHLTIVFSYETLKEWADLQKQMKKIERICLEKPVPVYDLTVENKNHNFAKTNEKY